MIYQELDAIKNSKTKRNTKDMLMNRFTESDMQIYQQIHTSSMKHGNIWEIVFLNYFGWERIKGLDGKSEIRKTMIELKNKATTLNSSSLKGTLGTIRRLKK